MSFLLLISYSANAVDHSKLIEAMQMIDHNQKRLNRAQNTLDESQQIIDRAKASLTEIRDSIQSALNETQNVFQAECGSHMNTSVQSKSKCYSGESTAARDAYQCASQSALSECILAGFPKQSCREEATVYQVTKPDSNSYSPYKCVASVIIKVNI